MKLRYFILLLLATMSTPSFSQTEKLETAPKKAIDPVIPYGNLQNASPADVQKSVGLGQQLAQDLLDAYNNRKSPEMINVARQASRRADDIADESLSKERNKMLNFLGIDPEGDSALYYFVSWSMPLEMLRSYAIEAMWAGGSLVFKGVPPNKDLGDFITTDLHGLVYGKGSAANISIDPRQFDAYDIKVVPTIVLTTVRANLQCQGVNPVSFSESAQELTYDTCPPLDEKSYVKISGAVTSTYALQAFIERGFEQAKPFSKALSRGYATGGTPVKEQRPFVGKWEDALAPTVPETFDSTSSKK